MWYVLQVKTGKEEEIRDKLNEYGFHALVPAYNKWVRSKGSWNKKKTIIFTGYVFVKLTYNAESYYRITSMEGVILKGILLNFKSKIKSYDTRQRKAVFEITICSEKKEITLSIDVVNAQEQDTSKE